MAGDAQSDARLAELRQLLMDRDIPFQDPDDLTRLVAFGYYNANLLSAATKEDLESRVGLTLALAGLLVKKFGDSSSGGRSAHEEPPGTDVSAFTKAVHDELDPIRKALERTSRSTVQASKISDDDLAALRDSVGAKVKYLSSDDDPEALTKLLIASPTNTDKVWGKEPEPDQRDMYHAVLRDNISASSRLFSWVDAKGLEVKLQVRGQYFKVVSKNDELLIVRNYGVEPPTGAVMGFEVKKALTKERLRQAEAEYYIFAHRSMFAYAQFYTDLTTGAVVFYSDKHADGQLTVNVHTLVGMSAVWDFAKAMLSAMPKDIGQACAHDDDFSPDELRSPKRIKLTGALFQPALG